MMRFFLLIFSFCTFLTANTEGKKSVTLQLNWKYQFEYAGFIAAKQMGFYEDVGLEVTLKELNETTDILSDIKSQKATFGVYDASLLKIHNDKEPIRLIANYLKRSALVVVTNQDIFTPEDLKGKKIMAGADQLHHSTLSALLNKFNLTVDDYTFVQHTFDAQAFIENKVDVMSAYLSNELYEIRQSKKAFNILDPSSFGIFGMGLNLFTSVDVLKNHEEMVQKFIEASNKGWRYALNNKDDMVNIIYDNYSKKKSKAALLYEAEQIEKLMMPNLYPIGSINKTLIQKNINDDFINNTPQNQFNVDLVVHDFKPKQEAGAGFSQEQKEYLRNKKVITMCIDPNWMPYEKIEKGKHIGMTAEYMPLLSQFIGIPIKLVPTKSWSESLLYAQERKCDIFSLAMSTPQRLKYMNFTKPYISFPTVIATRMDQIFISNPEELLDKKEIAVVRGYSIAEYLQQKYPNNKLVEVETIEEGLNLVAQGKLFGFIGALPAVAYSVQHNHISELKIAGKLDRSFDLGVGVRNDEPLLFELFDKAVDSISETQKQKILNKYISIVQEEGFDYSFFYKLFGLFAAIGLLGLVRYNHIVQKNKALEKTQKNLETLLDSVLEALIVFENQRCIEVNHVALKMFGYAKKEQLLGKHLKELVTQSSYDEVQKRVRTHDVLPYELKAVKKDGTLFPALVKGTNTFLNDKEVRISAVLDISELKHKDKLLYQQTKMAAMGEMLENIAHQWRQPLSVISSISTSLEVQNTLGMEEKEQTQVGLQKINHTAQHLSQTIEDFRNFFKKDKQAVSFCVEQIIKNSVSLLEGVFKNNSIQIVFDAKEKICICNFENEFTQALLNIFTNAKDALSQNVEEKIIFIGLKKEDAFVCISIQDSGGGIDEKIIEHVFEPYFTTKHQAQGTGIGLYMTHQIIEKHMGGNIWVENKHFFYKKKRYFGAEFTIKLPIK